MYKLRIRESKRFTKALKKLVKGNVYLLERVFKSLGYFIDNTKHPSINVEKLQGTDIWTMRVDLDIRIFFSWIDEKTVVLIDIGHHDKYRNY